MPALQLIRINSSGPLVKAEQLFLIGFGFCKEEVDGKFGPTTQQATIDFQTKLKSRRTLWSLYCSTPVFIDYRIVK